MSHGVRIAPLEPPYESGIEELLAKWMPPGAGVAPLALFRTLAVHNDLAARMRPLGAGILGSRIVDPVHREVIIARPADAAIASMSGGFTPSRSASHSV